MSLDLKLYNTLTRATEVFQPRCREEVRLYTCGPTVYNYAHIGNFRSYVYEDILRRALKFFGFGVRHVMQFTDVDDKTIRGARAAGLALAEFTQRFTQAFREDMVTLHIEPQEAQPNATDHIPEMIALVQKLMERGHAYASGDGSVYFRIDSWPDYGQLARLDKAGLQPGARVSQDEYQKESFGDFALWKAWTTEDGEVGWASPWGRGRPGWHIECSALALHFLGDQIDLHCGGIDLKFPHHENEIAQSEGATGLRFSRCWGHCEHLMVDNQKMSKSLGNLYTVRDVLARGYTGRQLRYALVATHYRQSLNFTWEGMDAAKSALDRIDAWKRRPEFAQTKDSAAVSAFPEKFRAALADDLNVSGALGHLFDFIRETNRQMDAQETVPNLPAIWLEVDRVLGLGDEQIRVPVEVQTLVDRRAQARKSKDWPASDSLRKEIEMLGWALRDKGDQQELVRK